jgi:hypothetical protein
MVRAVSRFTVTGAASSLLNAAVLPAPSAMMLPSQLVVELQ